jgi:predicted phosphoadenosine phosphosulfate sulfurtransferase
MNMGGGWSESGVRAINADWASINTAGSSFNVGQAAMKWDEHVRSLVSWFSMNRHGAFEYQSCVAGNRGEHSLKVHDGVGAIAIGETFTYPVGITVPWLQPTRGR